VLCDQLQGIHLPRRSNIKKVTLVVRGFKGTNGRRANSAIPGMSAFGGKAGIGFVRNVRSIELPKRSRDKLDNQPADRGAECAPYKVWQRHSFAPVKQALIIHNTQAKPGGGPFRNLCRTLANLDVLQTSVACWR
jgi:hypothetical protein